MEQPTVLASEERYAGRIVSLRLDTVRYPNGHTAVREVVGHPGGAVVVPLLSDGRILLIQQYRHPLKRMVYELPAGKLERGEPPELCAQRELEEETGYTAPSLASLGTLYTTPGFCDEVLHLYLAEDVTPAASGQRLEPGETLLTVHPFTVDKILGMITDGEICDGKTIAALFHLMRVQRRIS